MLNIYKNEWKIFKRDYAKIFIILLVLSLVLTFGLYFTLVNHESAAKQGMEALIQQFKNQGVEFDRQSHTDIFLTILKNNLRVVLISVLVGFIPLVILPAFSSIGTTLTIGLVLAFTAVNGHSVGAVFWKGIAPHGLLELPGIYLASSVGIYVSLSLAKRLFSGKLTEKVPFKPIAMQAFRTFIFVIVPVIVAAALIEGYITPLLLR